MAHNITNTNGKDEMAYVGETPWHGLGTKLERVATSQEMIRAAGLTWMVEKAPLFVRQPVGDLVVEVPGHVAIRRADTLEVLGVLSNQFRPIQNAECFQILDDIAGTAGAIYHTAGSIKGGRKVWALVKLPGNLVVGPDDTVDQYLALMNSHDGSMALTIRFTPVRIVCNNTLNLAFDIDETGRQRRTADAIYIRHSESADVRIEEVKRVLGIAAKSFTEAGESYRAMSAMQISNVLLKDYLETVVPMVLPSTTPKAEDLEAAATRQSEIHQAVIRCFEGGRGSDLATSKGTVWGAYNAVTEYVDHVYPVLRDGSTSKSRQESALFGTYAQMKRRAYSEAVALLP